jgi:hypothetical protein
MNDFQISLIINPELAQNLTRRGRNGRRERHEE